MTGRTFTRRVAARAQGAIDGNRRKIAVGFAPADFDALASMAEANEVSVAELIRRLCTVGLQNWTGITG
jgi:hypothetical protein